MMSGSKPAAVISTPRARRFGRNGLALVLVCATFCIRLGVALLMGDRYPFGRAVSDSYEYEQYARNIVQHGRYGLAPGWTQVPELAHSGLRYLYDRTGQGSFRPPGYPLVWAGLMRIGCDSRRSQEVMFALLESATVAL